MSIEKLQEQIGILNIKLAAQIAENETLKKEQKEFQDCLIAKVEEIQKLKFFGRIFQYGKLLFDLIEVITQAIQKQKTRVKLL